MELDKEMLENIINELIAMRGCFHSEDDMKFSLSCKIKEKIPSAKIRLERPFREVEGDKRNKPFYLDIFIETLDKKIGIELKYKTKELVKEVNGENYFLKSHVAIDLGRHAFCKDIERLETLVIEGKLDQGYAVFLTNDKAYCLFSTRSKKDSYDKNFRIHEGIRLIGDLKWNGDQRGWLSNSEYKPIRLRNEYNINWIDPCSKADENFRFTILDIQK